MRDFEGKVAVVIGGGTGLGLGAATELAGRGATVVIGGRRGEVADEVGSALGGWGAVCDITDGESLRRFVDGVVERAGRIDVAINCAGYEQSTPLSDLTRADLEAMVAVQFTGAIDAMGRCADAIAASGGGAYLNVSSLTGHRPAVGQIAYGASKRGLEYATEIAALEYGPKQVRVNCVAPSLVETPMTKRFFEMKLVMAVFTRQTPLGRMGSVDDVVDPMVFLVSDGARFVTGQTLIVDGGGATQKLPSDQEFQQLARLEPELLT